MIELSRHIESLLLVHNCVIVPNLGGFVAQNCPARYVKEEQLFLPPYRNIAFNPSLQMNDGLLAQSYMQAHGTDYTQTLRDIDRDVARLKGRLEAQEVVELNGIGRLSRLAEGRYDFIPYEGGVVAPSLYGLDAFLLTPRPNTACQADTSRSKRTDSYTLHINKRAFHYVAAVLVSVIFYFVWAAPLNNVSHNHSQEAQVFQPLAELLNTPQHEPASTAPMDAAPSQSASAGRPAADSQAQPSDKTASAEPADELVKQPFTIVLASQISRRGAESLIVSLKEQGFEEVRMLRTPRITRVVFGKYSTASEAQTALRRLRHQQETFSEAWVLELP